jgi:DNA-directed RNA polymerase subunit L
MELKLFKEDKDFIEFTVLGETHTLCNLMRDELWNLPETNFASYHLKHPLVSSPLFALKVNKGNPRKSFDEVAVSIKAKTNLLRQFVASMS